MSERARPHRYPRIRIGVSACLLGQQVRFDGGHKRDAFLTGPLAEFVDFVPLCPEVGIGMGVPRPPIRLVGDPEHPRAIGRDDSTLDVTDKLLSFARRQVPALGEVSGYILKKDSPSCGMERVKVYRPGSEAGERKGTGLFARFLMESMPLLPVEEEGRLSVPVLRENFIARIFVYHRWQRLTAAGITPRRLIEFHTDHKYLVMAHSQAAYERMGRMLANLAGADLDVLALGYLTELMTALKRRASRKHHANVLQHIMGYFKRTIDSGDKAELVGAIDAYRRGEVYLVVPIARLRHYLRRHPDGYLERQHYLHPYPDGLGLRDAI